MQDWQGVLDDLWFAGIATRVSLNRHQQLLEIPFAPLKASDGVTVGHCGHQDRNLRRAPAHCRPGSHGLGRAFEALAGRGAATLPNHCASN
jgi:hypothetical protein